MVKRLKSLTNMRYYYDKNPADLWKLEYSDGTIRYKQLKDERTIEKYRILTIKSK